MLFNSIFRRKLLSLLQPWLFEEPQLNLELGFFHSLAVVTNLRFDVAVLNKLFHSPPLLFVKDFTVERLVVRFSSWSSPAFEIKFHGVRAVLSLEKPEEDECVTRLRMPKDDYLDDLKKKLSEFDPEGCSLHQILEAILYTVHEKNSFSSSFLNLILKNCHLEAHDIRVDVQFPILNDEFVCFAEMKEISARSKHLDKKCLVRGFVGTVFVPIKESDFMLDGTGFKVGLNRKNCADRIMLSSDMKIFITFRDLKLVDCTLCFPLLACAFYPDDISFCLLFEKLLSDKFNQPRSARELWKIASRRIDHATVTPRFSLQRLVGIVGQWTHYVKTYEEILLLTGYSTGNIWKKSISKMSRNKLSSAKHRWELISDIEKKLPVEGISLARRIARHRAASKVPFGSHEECAARSNFFRPLLFIVAFIWGMILKAIQCLRGIFFGEKTVQDPAIDGCCLGSLIKDPCQRCCFVLNFGKITITVSQLDEIHPSVCETLQSHTGIAYSDFLSICFCIDSLLLVSVKDILEQRVFLSCGQMKVELTPSTMSAEESILSMHSYTTEGKGKEGSRDRKPLIWVEPAKGFLLSETNAMQAEDSFDSHIECFMGKLLVSWKEICSNFNESEIQYSQNPCLLCKIEISSSYSDHENPDYGFCECCLLVGKLNLIFSHSSVSSVSLILSQIQRAIYWEDKKEVCVVSNLLDKVENGWVKKYEYFSKKMILAMLQKLPERDIHLGVYVDGPSVRFSHRLEANISSQDTTDTSSQDDFDLIFDFHEIEVVVGSPPSLVGMNLLTAQPGLGDAKTECITLEPRVIEIPKPNNDKYASTGKVAIGSYLHLNGLNACLEKSTGDHQIQILILKPITLQMLCIRDYIYSLSTKTSSFSAALDITAGGFTVLSFLDEVYMIYKAIANFSSVVSYLFSSFEDVDCTHPEVMKWEAFFAVPDSNGAIIPGSSQTNDIFPFFIDGTCRINSVDVILHNSRTSGNPECNTRKFDILTGNSKAMKTLPDNGIWISIQQAITVISWEEAKMDLSTDLSGIMSSVFEYQNSIGNNHENIVLQNLLLRSVHCLHEISLSGCTFSLCLGLVQNASSSGNGIKTFGSSTSSSEGSTSHLAQETNLSVFERSNNQSSLIVKKMVPPTNISMQASESHWVDSLFLKHHLCQWPLITILYIFIILAISLLLHSNIIKASIWQKMAGRVIILILRLIKGLLAHLDKLKVDCQMHLTYLCLSLLSF